MHPNPIGIEMLVHIRHEELQAEAARERIARQAPGNAPRVRDLLAAARRLGTVHGRFGAAVNDIALAIRGGRIGANRA